MFPIRMFSFLRRQITVIRFCLPFRSTFFTTSLVFSILGVFRKESALSEDNYFHEFQREKYLQPLPPPRHPPDETNDILL